MGKDTLMAVFTRTCGTLTFSEAAKILRDSRKYVLKDMDFGDSELTWVDELENITACGYKGRTTEVIVYGGGGNTTKFEGETAKVLLGMHKSMSVERN